MSRRPRPNRSPSRVSTRASLFILFVTALFACLTAWHSPALAVTPDEVAKTTAALGVSSALPTQGAAGAPVTWVIFGDYQCPFTAKLMTTMRALEDKYGADKLRVVFRHFPLPFHTKARPAHVAAEAVLEHGGAKAFWKFHKLVFDEQADLSPEKIDVWAAAAGTDEKTLHAAVASGREDTKVDRDLADGKVAGVSGTPSSFINGVLVVGAQPQEKFATVIDDELKAVADLRKSGVPAGQVYARRLAVNVPLHATRAPAASAPQPPDTNVYRVPIAGSPVRGGANALVTLVMFGDFQCPFCGKSTATLAALKQKYGEDLRVVFKNNALPFHTHAPAAAELALEARAEKGDAGFWAAHDAMFAHQDALADTDLAALAGTLGLDVSRVKDAIATNKHAAAMEKDRSLAETLGAMATPTFFINGRRLVGAQPQDKFDALVDEGIKAAKAAIAAGSTRAAVYDALQKDAKTSPPPAAAPAQAAAPDGTAPTFSARHLLVMFKGSSRAPEGITRTREEARTRAEAALKKAKSGVAFEKVVAEFSDEPGAGQRGGDLGTFKRGTMVPEFQSAVEATPVGQLSGIVETPFGFHVILRTK